MEVVRLGEEVARADGAVPKVMLLAGEVVMIKLTFEQPVLAERPRPALGPIVPNRRLREYK